MALLNVANWAPEADVVAVVPWLRHSVSGIAVTRRPRLGGAGAR